MVINYLYIFFINNQRIITLFFVINTIFCVLSNNLLADGNDNYKIKTVVIDAGHGGKDPGAVKGKCYEKDIALAIALKLGNYIEENFNDVKVIYTRKTDVFVELYKRAEIANSNKADLFISIHVNANKNATPCGTETYVMGLHKTNDNLDVAKRENAVILIEDDYSAKYEGYDPNSTESFIIFSLLQNAYLEQSLNLAANVQYQFKESPKRIDRGVKQAGFLVLWKTTMPSILVETGFLSNPDEAKFLSSDTGQVYIASAILRAFRDYKNHLENKSGFTISENKTETDTIQQNSNNINVNDKTDVCFKIQIISSSKQIPLDSKDFKDLKDIEEFKINDTYKYTFGSKNNFDEIVKLQKKIRNKFPDAFIIAFKNGEKISVNEVIK
jgi:N-acetylmuramoyl-L-alanine amidase